MSLLDGLAARVHDRSSEPLSPETGQVLTVGDVERLLDDTPRDHLSRQGGATLLTDGYDFSDFERRAAGERAVAPMNVTAPIPLDLSDWGDAAPTAGDAAQSTDGRIIDGGAATDAHDRRNAASS